MKLVSRLTYFILCLGSPLLSALPAWADSSSDATGPYAAPNAYEQRYGQGGDVPGTSAASSYDNRAELDVSSLYDNDPSSNVNGGSSYGLETTLYSATIDDKWRLFAGELFSHEIEPFGEGQINYSRSMAGVQYDYNAVRASFAPTYNNYNGNERVGAAANTTVTLNRLWDIGGGAELFSRDTPLRALNAGITANAYNVNADLYQDAVRHVRFDGNLMTFSDDNVRTSLAGSDTEHLYVGNHFTFDGLVSAIESQNSEDELRAYFNPKQDVLGMVGGHVGEPLYSDSRFKYDHSLEVKPGVYWQENYGSSAAVTATYAQHISYNNSLDGSLGLSFTRQASDGEQENDLALLLNVSEKF